MNKLKILCLRNNVIDKATLNVGTVLANQWTQTIGLELDFIFVDVSNIFNSIPFSNATNANGHYIDSTPVFQLAKSLGIPFDIDLLVYDWTKVNGIQPTNPSDSGMNIQIPVQWYTEITPNLLYPSQNVFAEFLLHELCHYYFSSSGKLDITHNYDPAFTQLPRYKWYLHLLSTFITTTMPIYKHFTMGESTGSNGHTFGELDAGFRSLLDLMRDQCGFPWKITSGVRSVAQNASLSDAVGDSAHLSGLAVDIVCTDSIQRDRIVTVAKANGITRIGIGNGFVHLDISKTLAQNVMWTYY